MYAVGVLFGRFCLDTFSEGMDGPRGKKNICLNFEFLRSSLYQAFEGPQSVQSTPLAKQVEQIFCFWRSFEEMVNAFGLQNKVLQSFFSKDTLFLGQTPWYF